MSRIQITEKSQQGTLTARIITLLQCFLEYPWRFNLKVFKIWANLTKGVNWSGMGLMLLTHNKDILTLLIYKKFKEGSYF